MATKTAEPAAASMDDNSTPKTCVSCSTPIVGCWWAFWEKELSCDTCGGRLCKACHGKYPLMIVPDGKEKVLANGTVKSHCKSCFQQHSTLDFRTHHDTIQGSSGVVFVYVHGGGGSRQMYNSHALEMNQRYQHGAVLLDLPGHGTLVDTPLTLESCAEALEQVLKECGLMASTKKEKMVYVGGSLGAYIGFYLIDKFQSVFDGAVLMDCGQNVGPGASFKARMGLILLNWVAKNYSNADLMNMMVGVSKKSKADYKLIETCFGAGNFFDQGEAQVTCLKTVAPADYVGRVAFPILFMNGSEDHRDSENKWLELCKNAKSELKVYEGGDHFFCHDTRFLDDILTRMNDFVTKI